MSLQTGINSRCAISTQHYYFTWTAALFLLWQAASACEKPHQCWERSFSSSFFFPWKVKYLKHRCNSPPTYPFTTGAAGCDSSGNSPNSWELYHRSGEKHFTSSVGDTTARSCKMLPDIPGGASILSGFLAHPQFPLLCIPYSKFMPIGSPHIINQLSQLQ